MGDHVNGGIIMEQQHNVVQNVNEEDTVTTNLFDVLLSLQDAKLIMNKDQTVATDLLDMTIDTHGRELAEELLQQSKQKNNLFDMLVNLHGAEMTEELIYTCGKLNGHKLGKQLGKCNNPQAAVKHIHEHIQYHCEYDADDTNPNNEKYTETISFKNGFVKKHLTHKETVSFNPHHIRTKGFIEGTLAFMTGMQVNVDVTIEDKSKISFKPEKSFFGFL